MKLYTAVWNTEFGRLRNGPYRLHSAALREKRIIEENNEPFNHNKWSHGVTIEAKDVTFREWLKGII